MNHAPDRSLASPPSAAASAAAWLAAQWPVYLNLPNSARYREALAVWLGVFIAGFFVLPAEWPQRLLFYGGIPLTLPAAVAAARIMWISPLARVLAVFLGYSAISAVWSDNWLTVGDQTRKAACIAYFLTVCCAVGQGGPARWRWLLRGVSVFAAVAAVALAAGFLSDCTGCDRFTGYGRFANANYTASVTGSVALMALASVLSTPGRLRWNLLACQIPIVFLLLLTGSRAALLAYLGGAVLAGVLLGLRQPARARQTVLAILACLAMVAAAAAFQGPDWIVAEFGRGDTFRLQIWATNLERVAERPWFGHGSTAQDRFAIGDQVLGYHAHNLFLAQAFYGGIPGALLMLAVFVLAARAAMRAWWQSGDVLPSVILFFLFAVGMVDMGPVIVGIEAIWLYVWVTLGIVLSYDVLRRGRASATSR
jgi:O-antigen ligase